MIGSYKFTLKLSHEGNCKNTLRRPLLRILRMLVNYIELYRRTRNIYTLCEVFCWLACVGSSTCLTSRVTKGIDIGPGGAIKISRKLAVASVAQVVAFSSEDDGVFGMKPSQVCSGIRSNGSNGSHFMSRDPLSLFMKLEVGFVAARSTSTLDISLK